MPATGKTRSFVIRKSVPRAAPRRPCTSDCSALDCIASAMQMEVVMAATKSRTIPPLRVSEQLRADAEGVLGPGETLSAFVMDAVSRSIDFRKTQLEFLARGMASAERA